MLLPILIALAVQPTDPLAELARYDVTWTEPGKDASDSMPLGNGRFGANVWTEAGGDVCMYLSHTDAWSEANRVLKLGTVRLSFEPSGPFTQRLDLAGNCISLTRGEVSLTLAFDPDADVLLITGDAGGTKVAVTYETWRTAPHDPCADAGESKSCWTMREGPESSRVIESADASIDTPDALVWRHRNTTSAVPFTLKHQGLEPIASQFVDTLINRTSGVRITSPQLRKLDASRLAGDSVGAFSVAIAARCAQDANDDIWLGALPAVREDAHARARAASERAWSSSYIFVSGDPASAPLPRNTHPLRIGADSNGGNLIDADLRRVAIWNRTLPPEACAELTASLEDIKDHPANVIAAWSATVGDATTLTDAGENGHAMRAIGALPPVVGERAVKLGAGRFETASHERLDLSSDRVLDVVLRPRSNGRMLDKLTAGTSDGFLFDIHHGRPRLITGNETLHADTPVPMGQWVHLAAVIGTESGRREIYMNGRMIASAPSAPTPSLVTRAYVLSTAMTRWASRGGFPIKFNGSIFTVEPRPTNGAPYNADFRNWGGDYWWQNTRLSYEPMLARGEWSAMDSLFATYERVLPGAKARTKLYYGADGVYFPETMTQFGTYANGDYGWNREGAKIGDIHCPWWQWSWQQNLELTDLMLRRYAYSLDREFLETRALPMARESLRYYSSRFPRDDKGLLRITPTQAVETYWHGVVNDTPTVAGLHAVLNRLNALPDDMGSPSDRAEWRAFAKALPPIPTRDAKGVTLIAPAAEYEDKQSNVENPELYAVHPFNLYSVGQPGLDVARASYAARHHKSTVGWTQDGMVAAMLGLTDEAAAIMGAKARNNHRAHRFPAIWGPNFDWLPDQCHNGNITNTLQLMAIQNVAGKIHLLPAWPKSWDVSFRLWAEGGTVVECEYRSGKIVSLKVTPESRRGDIVLPQE